MFKKIILPVLLLTACYFPLFLHLDSLALFSYDESRLALNAIEMMENGNLIVTHFNGEPDMWNTKPPLMIWLQALSMRIFGINELGVRLPAALAALMTLFFIGFFCRKYLKRPLLGIFAILVLITTPGYITTHVSRTGDYDALLILFSTMFLFTFFEYISSRESEQKKKLILWSALWLSLAVLTKSIAGLLFLPAVAIYVLWKKETVNILKSRQTYFAKALFLLLVGGYYALREYYNPGYLQAVWNNELGGRYLDVLENHKAPFSYYFKNIWKAKFLPWLFFLPLSLIIAWFEKGKVRDFIHFLIIAILSFLLILSFSQSKFEWYDAPIYPLLAVIIAIGIEKIYLLLQQNLKIDKTLLLVIFCIALFGIPYKTILSTVYYSSHSAPINQYAAFMKEYPYQDNYAITHLGYNSQILFYEKVYTDKGYHVRQKYPDQLHLGEKALICEAKVLQAVKEGFEYEVLESWKTCKLIRITARE